MPTFRLLTPARVFLGLTCLLFLGTLAGLREPAVYRLMNLPLGDQAIPHFADASVVLGGADAVRANGGRFSWDDLSARHESYNYPRVWTRVAWLGLGRGQVVGVGLALAALLLVCQYRLLRPRDGWTLAFAVFMLLSPSCLLLLDRGNNDILILSLVLAATAWLGKTGPVPRGAGGVLLLAAACLKLYPIAAIAAVTPRRDRWTVAGGGALLACFGLYVFTIREDLGQIARMTPRPYHGAYGGLVLTSFVGTSLELRAAVSKLGLDLSAPARLAAVQGAVRAVSYAAMLLLGGGAMLAGVRAARRAGAEVGPEGEGRRFRAGAAIYGGTFLIGNNWDYRLVFLSLTVPLLFGWLNGGNLSRRRVAGVTLVLIVLCQWGFSDSPTVWSFWLMQLSTWALFVVLAFLFGQLLPAGLGDPVRRASGWHGERVRAPVS